MRDGTPNWSVEPRARLGSLRLSPEREAAIVEELAQHLDDRWRYLVAGGASAHEATRTIEAELGNRDGLKNYMSQIVRLLKDTILNFPLREIPGRGAARQT